MGWDRDDRSKFVTDSYIRIAHFSKNYRKLDSAVTKQCSVDNFETVGSFLSK